MQYGMLMMLDAEADQLWQHCGEPSAPCAAAACLGPVCLQDLAADKRPIAPRDSPTLLRQMHVMMESWSEAVMSISKWALAANAGTSGVDGALGNMGDILLRFAAHMALALRALGLVRSWEREEGTSRQEPAAK